MTELKIYVVVCTLNPMRALGFFFEEHKANELLKQLKANIKSGRQALEMKRGRTASLYYSESTCVALFKKWKKTTSIDKKVTLNMVRFDYAYYYKVLAVTEGMPDLRSISPQ